MDLTSSPKSHSTPHPSGSGQCHGTKGTASCYPRSHGKDGVVAGLQPYLDDRYNKSIVLYIHALRINFLL